MIDKEKVTFIEDTHQYFLEDTELPSVSSLVDRTHDEFKKQEIASAMSKSYGESSQHYIDKWQEEADKSIYKGNHIHNIAELMCNLHIRFPDSSFKLIYQLVVALHEILKQQDVEVIATEDIVYSEKYMYAGTVDLLIYNRSNNTVSMYDYKTNKNIHKNYKGKRLLSPFNDMLETPCNKYFIQQNLYNLALEEHGIYVDNMYLIWINENYEHAQLIEVPDLKQTIKQWLK